MNTVRVHFDANVNDPASYDFQLTDEYCDIIQKAGAKVFYRLGSKIEHESKKYGTLVHRYARCKIPIRAMRIP